MYRRFDCFFFLLISLIRGFWIKTKWKQFNYIAQINTKIIKNNNIRIGELFHLWSIAWKFPHTKKHSFSCYTMNPMAFGQIPTSNNIIISATWQYNRINQCVFVSILFSSSPSCFVFASTTRPADCSTSHVTSAFFNGSKQLYIFISVIAATVKNQIALWLATTTPVADTDSSTFYLLAVFTVCLSVYFSFVLCCPFTLV